eukprot:1156620-Pelagomonas_calceolata.AAC.7
MSGLRLARTEMKKIDASNIHYRNTFTTVIHCCASPFGHSGNTNPDTHRLLDTVETQILIHIVYWACQDTIFKQQLPSTIPARLSARRMWGKMPRRRLPRLKRGDNLGSVPLLLGTRELGYGIHTMPAVARSALLGTSGQLRKGRANCETAFCV